jgi:hypothetical protein
MGRKEMIPANERFYGSLPRSGMPPPFVTLEPRALGKMSLPLTTLKNPGNGDMYRNEAQASSEKMIPHIATFKGWGLAK